VEEVVVPLPDVLVVPEPEVLVVPEPDVLVVPEPEVLVVPEPDVVVPDPDVPAPLLWLVLFAPELPELPFAALVEVTAVVMGDAAPPHPER
jgi:hypothetical protein